MKNFTIGNKTFDLTKKTLLMGILNVTPDSFSDGGKHYTIDDAIEHAVSMEKQGADIIDIGGESTRPGAQSVTLKEEINRVIPVIEKISNTINIPLSVDTYKAKVAEKAIHAGAALINDITALQGDKKLIDIVSKYEIPICLMHMKGKPQSMQQNPTYEDVVTEIITFLQKRTEYAIKHHVKKEHIIIDPGLGFGKRTGKGIEDNCEILKRLPEFSKLGYPLLIGASRKTFIGNVCGKHKQLPIHYRLEGSLAAACVAALHGANILRVHDVEETRRCLNLIDHIKNK